MSESKETPTNQISNLLFGKYQEEGLLGQGSFCTTYLVRHISLGQQRAMKVYPKDPASASADLPEAHILKSLSHPGIPIIYDLEEDETFFYVLEEYIRGESLDEFLLHQPLISEAFFYPFAFQLCDIFSYLHTKAASPIIYRDLKPEHLILSKGQVKLIDFNISAFEEAWDNNLDHFGNLSFSSPESFSCDRLTFASDLYSIGKLLEYLSAHLENKPSRDLRKIIKKALQPDPLLRYETVEELKTDLQKAQKNKDSAHLTKTIAIVGSHPGCGATHLAIALVSTLNYLGISAVCYEKNDRDSLRNAAERKKQMQEQDGFYHYRFFIGQPRYGPGVSIPECRPAVRVLDYGADFDLSDEDEREDWDLILCIGTGSVWRQKELGEKLDFLMRLGVPLRLIGNLCTKESSLQLAAYLGQSVHLYPMDDMPFCVTRKKKRFFKSLLAKTDIA